MCSPHALSTPALVVQCRAHALRRCLLLCASPNGMLRLLELSPFPQARQRSFPLDATPRKLALCQSPRCIVLLCNTVQPELAPSNPIGPHETSDRMADGNMDGWALVTLHAHAACMCVLWAVHRTRASLGSSHGAHISFGA